MAGSRSFTNTCNGNHGSHYTQTLTVNWGDYDISNNRTYVSIIYQRSTNNQSSYYNYGYANPSQISIDGSQVASATPYSAHNTQVTQTLCTWEGWINHNNDGTKTINVGASFSSSSSNLSGGSVSGTVALPTIPRASGINATASDIGSNTTISINRASSSFTHTITYSFGSLSGTIATKTSSTSITWTVPSTFYAQISNAKYGTCTLTCTTYSGNTQIGSPTTTTFRATANETLCKPTVSGTAQDINPVTIALTGETSKLVKYKSTAQISTNITAKNSATISRVTLNGATFDGTPISNVETGTFDIVATDSRGYSTAITITIPIVDYIPLSATSSFKRDSNTSNGVTLTYSGNYFDDDFGTENNTLSLSYKYREKGSNTWIDGQTTLNPTITDNTFSETVQLSESFNYRKNWEFSLYYEDELISGNTGVNDVLKGNGALEVYDEAVKVNGDLIVSGGLTLGGSPIIESGSGTDGSYIKYADGTMICYKTVTGSVAIATQWASLYEGSLSLGDWEKEFFDTPKVQVTNVSGYGAFIESIDPSPTKTSAGTVYLARPNTMTISAKIDVFAIGKWK